MKLIDCRSSSNLELRSKSRLRFLGNNYSGQGDINSLICRPSSEYFSKRLRKEVTGIITQTQTNHQNSQKKFPPVLDQYASNINPLNNSQIRVLKPGNFNPENHLSGAKVEVENFIEKDKVGSTRRKKIDFQPTFLCNREYLNSELFDRKKKSAHANRSSSEIDVEAGQFVLPRGRKLYHKSSIDR